MGPAFANLLEIGGDQYEYIKQSVILMISFGILVATIIMAAKWIDI